MNRGMGLALALAMAFLTACATGGAAGGGEAGYRPSDTPRTRSAGINLAQGATSQGEEARQYYASALEDALAAIQEDTLNPRAYLLAGQAAVGVGDWVQADTMFDRAVELYPTYESQIASEREQGWIAAYNTGVEVMNAGDYEAAIEHFRGADILFDERPEAKIALGALYLRQGEAGRAAEAYREALDILMGPPPAGMDEEQAAQWVADRQTTALNTAQLLAQAGRFEEAAELLEEYMAQAEGTLEPGLELQMLTARAGFLAQAGRADEAETLYREILAREDLSATEYFQAGIGFFNTGDYSRAAEAFERAAELNPYSRDALLNLVQSLYSEAAQLEEQEESEERNARLHELYDQLIAAADRVREFDPLNRNLLSFMLRGYRAKADISPAAQARELERRTQEIFREYQQQSYEVSDITLAMRSGGRAEISGMFTNIGGTPGEQVTLRFSLLGANGNVMRTADVAVTVPPQGEAVEFSETVELGEQELAGWRYEMVR